MNDIVERYLKRIDELLTELNELSLSRRNNHGLDILLSDDDSEAPQVHQLFSATLNIASNIFGGKSPQVKSLVDQRKMIGAKKYINQSDELRETCHLVSGVLTSTKNDIELGLISRIIIQASGAVIGDFIAIAKNELKVGSKDVAAVLASAALEDALKRKADELGIKTENKDLSAIINALKSQGFIGGAQGPIVSSFVKLRNSAMHADWSKIQETDVNSMIGFLEPFLIKNFS